MRDGLAERLLANVMGWSPADVARERPVLQALALLKYDEYQQFSPGMRFVESLALWLEQFKSAERQTAYAYVLQRLIFLSHAEMAHFAAIAYPDIIRPILLTRAAEASGVSRFLIRRLLSSESFRKLQAATLFFGLSDGARIDLFRRSNREISHEQIFASYELSNDKVGEIEAWLSKHQHVGPVPAVVLLDDFAGSGTSCLKEEDGRAKGKVAKFLDRTKDNSSWKRIFDPSQSKIVVVLYVATERAIQNFRAGAAILKDQYQVDIRVASVQLLRNELCMQSGSNDPLLPLVEAYYDPSVEDEHTKKGGTDLKYGFSGCGLPLVLHHNTPNNSIFLLWAEGSHSVRALFPRISRHRRET